MIGLFVTMNDSDDDKKKPDDNDQGMPNPEELAKKLQEMLQGGFGGGRGNWNPVDIMAGFRDQSQSAEEETPPPPTSERSRDPFSFSYHPRDIKAHLDRYVIRQDEAKKALSIAVCDHYNHAAFIRDLEAREPGQASRIELAKQNVIVVGPTGCGKTYLVKHIAELIGVPFVKADATKFSETGYVGGDVDDLIRELVDKANGDVSLAEYGIIYIDEIDKLATSGQMMGRDVSGRGVQTTLLKLMEETEVPRRNPMDLQGQMGAMFDMAKGSNNDSKDTVNTRNILFIVSGAFSGLQKIITGRMTKGEIGFGSGDLGEEEPLDSAIFANVTTQDFIDFGFEAEFVGRLPVRVVCEELSADDLYQIMMTSEGSILRQYELEFEAYGIKVKFEDEALRQIAEEAAVEKTGARALLTVCERILRDFKFELPGTSIEELVVDAELIREPDKVLKRYLKLGRGMSDAQVVKGLEVLSEEFVREHGIDLTFSADAIEAIGDLCRERDDRVIKVCKKHFKDYQFGLKLIMANTGQDSFEIPVQAVRDPENFLSSAVVASAEKAKVDAETKQRKAAEKAASKTETAPESDGLDDPNDPFNESGQTRN